MLKNKKSQENDVILSGIDDSNIVQKSRPLLSLWESGFTLDEFKMLDIYLSRINSRNPEQRTVVFEKGDLEKALGIQRIRQEVLEERLLHLMGTVVKITDKRKPQGFILLTLFEEAVAEKDKNGQWILQLTCTPRAQEYFFNIEKLGYLRYKLSIIMQIKSIYTYIMFCYLESIRQYRKTWTIEIEELRHILRCEYEVTYQQYKYFNNMVLKKAHQELAQIGYKYQYSAVKTGRKVTGVEFKLSPLPSALRLDTNKPNSELTAVSDRVKTSTPQKKEEIHFSLPVEKKEAPVETEKMVGYADATNHQYNEKQLRAIVKTLESLPEEQLPPGNTLEERRIACLRYQYQLLQIIQEQKKIAAPILYLMTMIVNYSRPQQSDPVSSLHSEESLIEQIAQAQKILEQRQQESAMRQKETQDLDLWDTIMG